MNPHSTTTDADPATLLEALNALRSDLTTHRPDFTTPVAYEPDPPRKKFDPRSIPNRTDTSKMSARERFERRYLRETGRPFERDDETAPTPRTRSRKERDESLPVGSPARVCAAPPGDGVGEG